MTSRRILALTTPKADNGFMERILPALEAAGARVSIVDPLELKTHGLTFKPGRNGTEVWLGEEDHLTDDPNNTSVYFGKPAEIPKEFMLAWRFLVMALEGMFWLNNFVAIARAGSKPLQLQVAARLVVILATDQVRVPRWTMSSNKEQAAESIREEWRLGGGVCLSKPLKSTAKNPAVLLRRGKDDPHGIQEARILEQYVPLGREITVQVVEELDFPGEYRDSKDGGPLPAGMVDIHELGGNTKLIPHELPSVVADFCRMMVKDLDLRSARIDLRLDDQGRYWFLEANPVGLWDKLQDDTGQEIGQAQADLLLAA